MHFLTCSKWQWFQLKLHARDFLCMDYTSSCPTVCQQNIITTTTIGELNLLPL